VELTATTWLHAGSAVLCTAWTVLILSVGRGRHAAMLAACTAVAALWAAGVALQPEAGITGWAAGLEVLRDVVWFAVLLLLCRAVAGPRAGALRGVALVGVAVGILAAASLVPSVAEALTLPTLGPTALLPRLALALLVVLMAENLYRNAPEAARWHVVLPCIALGGLAALDVVLYADAALSRRFSPVLMDARAVLVAIAAPLLAVAAVRGRRLRRELPVSREFAFHGATLMVAGTFLLAVGAASEALREIGEPWVGVAQTAMLAAALMGAAVALSARSVRSRLRRAIADPFFRARYDYRREWLRCIATLSLPHAAADERAVRALADPVDSPAGLLLLREAPDAPLRWAGGWNAGAGVLSREDEAELVNALRGGQWVAEPGPQELPGARALLSGLWLVVPLTHHRDGLMGAVLLARPRAPFSLDREVFDLLRMLGREVAMFLAERRGAERLAEQAPLEAYARRFAFVAHDVKTVAHQLTMLLDNADTHIADPEFQADMLLTVRASADRINTLIARLRAQPDGLAAEAPSTTDALARLRALTRARPHPVEITHDHDIPQRVAMAPDQFDSAVTHLLDNAAEAGPPGAPIRLRLLREGTRLILEIADDGPGMSEDFVRDALFRPLATSKPHGNGIGAWQARELLRRAGGELDVVTSPGRGTTMRLWLPLEIAERGPERGVEAA
jgi:putative PEP-CTERM system histidine kinase